MRKALLAASFAVAVCSSVAFVGCSSGYDTSTYAAACDSAATAYCNRVYSCYPNAGYYGGSAGNCATQLQTLFQCSTQTCPTGTTYNSSAAQTCINDYANIPCTGVQPQPDGGTPTAPSSCSSVCKVDAGI